MVLAELWWSMSRAIQKTSNSTIIDEKDLDECLQEMGRALLQSDVPVMLVSNFQSNVKKMVNLQGIPSGHSKLKVIRQAIFKELCQMLCPEKPSFTLEGGKTNVVMFVGLQGSGKTTTCTKYARYYVEKNWNSALVCADTFKAGAFDQLKQNAMKVPVEFFGSNKESDPVKIATTGVENYKKFNWDVIIVDTSGGHKQEVSLFEEMSQVAEAIKPDLVILVIDGSIGGQAAFDQAQAFKQSAAVGAVILTKMDGHSKGGAAFSAVAATKSPIIFIGTGQGRDDFEVFDAKAFVTHLLGIGDWSGHIYKIPVVVPMEQQSKLLRKVSEGNFTLSIMYEQLQNMLEMSPIGQEFVRLPGFRDELIPKGRENESHAKIKRYMTMMDSMTNEELDDSTLKLMNDLRIIRIAGDSGHQVREVIEMFEEYMRLGKKWRETRHRYLRLVGKMSMDVNGTRNPR